MADRNILKFALLPLAQGKATQAEREFVETALESGQFNVTLDERAVLGGSLTGGIIVTGNENNIVAVFEGPEAETLHPIIQHMDYASQSKTCSQNTWAHLSTQCHLVVVMLI